MVYRVRLAISTKGGNNMMFTVLLLSIIIAQISPFGDLKGPNDAELSEVLEEIECYKMDATLLLGQFLLPDKQDRWLSIYNKTSDEDVFRIISALKTYLKKGS